MTKRCRTFEKRDRDWGEVQSATDDFLMQKKEHFHTSFDEKYLSHINYYSRGNIEKLRERITTKVFWISGTVPNQQMIK